MMSSLYVGATGMKTQSTGMNVIANNLANINSVSYKQQTALFEDIMSGYLTTGAGTATNISQSGAGALVSDIRTLFTQGSFETTTSSTDLAINGIGFFGVTQNGQTRYTRAGNFSITADGVLVDANGWSVLGRSITNGQTSSTLGEVKIDWSTMGSMAASASTQITACANLGGLEDASSDASNPLFSLATAWDGTSSPPLSSSDYSYAQQFQYYDSNGLMRTGSIYYDLVDSTNGMTAVEYVVAMDPSEDGSSLAGTQAAGLLAAGTMTFSSSGALVNMTAFTPPSSGDNTDLSGWTAASVKDGYPVLSVTPSGAKQQSISLNMGMSLPGGNAGSGMGTAAALSADPTAAYTVNTSAKTGNVTSTMYGSSTGIVAQSCNGYAPGDLSNLYIGEDGTVTGLYSNGQQQDLFRVSLFRFTSQDGLIHEGNGQYSASSASGAAEEGVAGDENFGTITSNALEQSNVDYAAEFTNLIVTQRGFQMNSKVITTTDTMLQKALELKR